MKHFHQRTEELLTPKQIAKIFELRAGGYHRVCIAERYGISTQWLDHILARSPGCGGSLREGLGPRLSRADRGQDSALGQGKVQQRHNRSRLRRQHTGI